MRVFGGVVMRGRGCERGAGGRSLAPWELCLRRVRGDVCCQAVEALKLSSELSLLEHSLLSWWYGDCTSIALDWTEGLTYTRYDGTHLE